MATLISTSRPPQAASESSTREIQRATGNRLRQGVRKATCALGLLQLLPLLLAAQNPRIARLFPDRPTNYLTDAAGIVASDAAMQINDLAARLRTASGAELAVVTLSTIEDQAPGEVALAIGRAWGVGGKGEIGDSARNAGVVLLLVPRTVEHRGEVYIATGRGIEGIITDAMAGRITDLMLPYLKEGRWSDALVLGTRAIAAVTAKGFGVSDSTLEAADPFRGSGGGEEAINPLLIFVLLVIVMIALSSMSSGGGRRGRRGRGPRIVWGGGGFGGGGFGGGGWGGGSWGGGGGGGGFGGFGGGGGFSGGGAGRSF